MEKEQEDGTPWLTEFAALGHVPPPPTAPDIGERLRASRRLHQIEEEIGDRDDSEVDDELLRERAECLAEVARVPWRKRSTQCRSGCCPSQVRFQGHP